MRGRDGKSQRREEKRREEERRSKKRKSQKKEDPNARKGRKVAKHCVFPMICGPGGWKSRLAKAAGAELCGQVRDEKLHAAVAQSNLGNFRHRLVRHYWYIITIPEILRNCGFILRP
jgi:hypothetical protein